MFDQSLNRIETITAMKNANIFVDVDLTLVDANGRLLEGAREGLEKLKDNGCHLHLWSTCGADYCRKIAQLHGLSELFDGFSAKPDILIDDMAATCTTSLIYNVQAEKSWGDMAGKIIKKHVDQ